MLDLRIPSEKTVSELVEHFDCGSKKDYQRLCAVARGTDSSRKCWGKIPFITSRYIAMSETSSGIEKYKLLDHRFEYEGYIPALYGTFCLNDEIYVGGADTLSRVQSPFGLELVAKNTGDHVEYSSKAYEQKLKKDIELKEGGKTKYEWKTSIPLQKYIIEDYGKKENWKIEDVANTITIRHSSGIYRTIYKPGSIPCRQIYLGLDYVLILYRDEAIRITFTL